MLDPTTAGMSDAGTLTARLPSPPDAVAQPPDLLLIERARGGDARAIEALITRFGGRLFRLARSVTSDAARAEAVVQEAYLCAFADLSRYEPTGKFGAWLSRLTYQQARLLGPVPRGRAASAAVAPSAPQLQEPAELERAIDALPEVFRTVFVLRVVEGISGIETAASLGVHETTVRTRLYRALRRLDAEVTRRARMHEKVMELTGPTADRLAQAVLARLPRRATLNPSAT